MPRLTSARKAHVGCVSMVLSFLFSLGSPAWGDARGPVYIAGPAGWTQVPQSAFAAEPNVVAAWIAPPDTVSPFKQNVNFMRATTTTGSVTSDVAGNIREIQNVEPGVTVLENRANKRCLSNSSRVAVYSLQRDGRRLVVEQVFTLASGALFIATYSRDSLQPAVSAATRSVEGMCPL